MSQIGTEQTTALVHRIGIEHQHQIMNAFRLILIGCRDSDLLGLPVTEHLCSFSKTAAFVKPSEGMTQGDRFLLCTFRGRPKFLSHALNGFDAHIHSLFLQQQCRRQIEDHILMQVIHTLHIFSKSSSALRFAAIGHRNRQLCQHGSGIGQRRIHYFAFIEIFRQLHVGKFPHSLINLYARRFFVFEMATNKIIERLILLMRPNITGFIIR